MRFITTLCLTALSLFSFAQTLSKYIVVDQFGYMTEMQKVAILRDPQTGYDASESFAPGSNYAVINTSTSQQVFTGTPTLFNNGTTDASSGDKVWWFDFSSVKDTGTYYILDITNNVKSYTFKISNDVYKDVLKAAVRAFFYQRVGCAKEAKYAGTGWADGASHIGALQDKNCRLYNAKTNAATEKDLSGGWYDAGDFNKYTPWTASYVVALLRAYKENPSIWTDDYNIPESGNGIPDILDEIKWGMDFLLRMQQADGSCLSIVGESHKSPPSSATGQSLYGPANTVSASSCAGAFALGALVFGSTNNNSLKTYADTLRARALKAWTWSLANPYKIFHNNSSANGSTGLGAGDQETDSSGRFEAKMIAAVYLYELTNDANYKNLFEQYYQSFPLFAWSNFVDQYRFSQQDILMYYTGLTGVTASVVTKIKTTLKTAFTKTGDFIGKMNADPYRTFIKSYNWGSNAYKGKYGIMFYEISKYNIDAANNQKYLSASQEYVHYIHGVNPFNMVYLTNMSTYGAKKSITTIYHTWFTHGSTKWDETGVSTYGPAPGILSGGANENYTWDGCCDTKTCGSTANNNLCTSMTIPAVNEPQQKSYQNFNNSWPLNSWQITENSCGYQSDYIRNLSLTIGSLTPVITSISNDVLQTNTKVYPNPAEGYVIIELPAEQHNMQVSITDLNGRLVDQRSGLSGRQLYIDLSEKALKGLYFMTIQNESMRIMHKIVVQ